MLPAVAVKLAEVEPAATVAVAGTVNAAALLESVTIAGVAAVWLRVTVQFEVPPLVNEDGVHDKLFTTDVATVVMVPPLPVTVMAVESAAAPTALFTAIAVVVTAAFSVTFTVATTPLDIRLAFKPARMQVKEPA